MPNKKLGDRKASDSSKDGMEDRVGKKTKRVLNGRRRVNAGKKGRSMKKKAKQKEKEENDEKDDKPAIPRPEPAIPDPDFVPEPDPEAPHIPVENSVFLSTLTPSKLYEVSTANTLKERMAEQKLLALSEYKKSRTEVLHLQAAKRKKKKDRFDMDAWIHSGLFANSKLNRKKFLHDDPIGLKHTEITFDYDEIPIQSPFFVIAIVWFTNIIEWSLVGMVVCSFYLLTYTSVFQFFQTEIFYAVYTIDMLFLCDAFMRIGLEVWRYVRDVPCIILISPYTIIAFFADVISIIPLERFYIFVVGTDHLTDLASYDFFRYNRVLRFTRIFNFLSVAKKERRISEKLNFFMKYFLIYIGFIQVCACLFHLSLDMSPMDILLQKQPEFDNTWLENMDQIKPGFELSPVDLYTLAIYFSTSVVTTTGYGEMEAHSIGEMVFCIVVMLFGSIIFPGLFQSGLTNFELKTDGARFDLFYRLEAVSKHLIEIKASALFRRKVREYYPLLWNFREGVLHVPFFAELPTSMQGDIKYDFCQEMFHKSALFRGLDESFLRAVAAKVQVVITNPEMLLFAQGDYAMKMYYIIQGEVLAKSKFRKDKGRNTGGAVIRAGGIIGEINLFFSYPYSTEVWTRTCCQLLKIEKEELLSMLDEYPTILESFRDRVQKRFSDLHNANDLVGHEPILWVEAKETTGFGAPPVVQSDFPILMRWNSYKFNKLNRIVKEDVIDDSQSFVVVDMPCIDPAYAKSHTRVYQTSLVPNILASESAWVHFWVAFTMILAMFTAFIEPYCLCFNAASGITSVMCEFDWEIEYVWLCYYIFDIFVEITQSTPSTGLYYQIIDGLSVKYRHFWFYVDLVAAIPFLALVPLVHDNEIQHALHVTTVFLRCTKLWKVFRYFNYLDNHKPSKLFYFRLIQTIIVLLFATHFLACMYFYIACPAASRRDRPICQEQSWLNSYHIMQDASDGATGFQYLGNTMPYLLSFYFSSATLTSAGFGDFAPQTTAEVYATIIFCLISFYIICYYTAILTSALSCTVRAKLIFENKLTSVRQFMAHYGITEALQRRVLEHYHLQSQLWDGVTLPPDTCHYLFDTPEYLQDDALYIEVEELFDGVPIFSKLDPRLIVRISKLIRRYLIPPGVVFLRRAEVRRQMYIIGKGSVGMFADGNKDPLIVLEASSHFGIRDLMLGEPAHHHIKTLSYCLIFEVELRDLKFVLEKEPALAVLISETKDKIQDHIDAMVLEFSHRRTNIVEIHRENRSWFQMPTQRNPVIENCTYTEYDEFFKSVKFGRVFRILLLSRTVNPSGQFAKLWTAAMSCISYLTIVSLVTESFMSVRLPWLRYCSSMLDFTNIVDIYIRLHWAYYTEKHLLISHPLMCALHYIFDGGFCYDILFCMPFELCLAVTGATNLHGYSGAAFWFTKMRWTRIGQVLRLPAVLKICHNIFTARSSVLCILYVTMTLFLCTAMAAVASYIACPSGQARWEPDHVESLPFCRRNSWTTAKSGSAITDIKQRWVMGVYYVSQVIFVIGFGDMIRLREPELFLLIFMMLFGFIILRCVLSDITAAEVELDEARLDFLEDVKRLKLIMYREEVPTGLIKSVVGHLTRTWSCSKGLQPKQLFADLHPALQSDVYKNFVGEQLISVPIFNGLTENVVRTLCQYLTKVFFLKGERLMRHGNLEWEMYIIVDGKVWITDNDLNWICTIQTGETFGETSMLNRTRRSYNAIAGSHVEVFALTAEGFDELLERYPVVETDLKRKLGKFGDRDLFERLITARIMDHDLKESQTKKVRAVVHAKDVVDTEKHGPRTRKCACACTWKEFAQLLGPLGGPFTSCHGKANKGPFFKRIICDYGPADDHLPFLYFATTKNGKFKFLIHPRCLFMRSFMMLVMVLSVITPGFGVLYACFSGNDPSKTLLQIPWVFNTALSMEIVMYIRIGLVFITPFEADDGTYCKVFRIIAFRYGTSFSHFWLDLIASFPVYAIMRLHPSVRYLGFLRCIRLIHFYRVQFSKKDDLNRSTFRYKVSISVISFLLMAHFLACIFYWISPCACPGHKTKDEEDPIDCIEYVDPRDDSRSCGEQTWTYMYIVNRNIDPKKRFRFEMWRWYIRSLYWVVTTISTTGFGGITPISIPETLLAVVCIFCGSFVLSIILSHFTSGIASLTKTHREYLYQVDILTKHYSNIGMSELRRYEINAYFLGLWECSRGVPYHKSTEILPITMRIEVCHALYYQVLGETRLFQPYHNKAFLRQLCSRVEHSYILPGTNVVCEGDIGDRLYIVFRGTVAGYTEEGKEMTAQVSYTVSECFGKVAAFFFDSAYDKSYRAETDVEVLTLSQREIVTLATYFPDFSHALQTYISKHFAAMEGRVCIFQAEKETQEDERNVKKKPKKTEAKPTTDETKIKKKKREGKDGKKKSRKKRIKVVTAEPLDEDGSESFDSDDSRNLQANLQKLIIQTGAEYKLTFGETEEPKPRKHSKDDGKKKHATKKKIAPKVYTISGKQEHKKTETNAKKQGAGAKHSTPTKKPQPIRKYTGKPQENQSWVSRW